MIAVEADAPPTVNSRDCAFPELPAKNTSDHELATEALAIDQTSVVIPMMYRCCAVWRSQATTEDATMPAMATGAPTSAI